MKEDEVSRISNFAALAAVATALSIIATETFASQGPGTAHGTASAFTQTATAIAVYGLSALIVAAGLIGALRQPRQ